MHVAIVNEGSCYPPTAGNRIRTLNLMLRLAGRHRITYIWRDQGDREEVRSASGFLREHGIEPIAVDDPALPKLGPMFYGRLATNLLSPLPYAVASHNSRKLREVVRRHAAEVDVDLWQFEWFPYADAVRDMGVPSVVIAHNVESLIWERYGQAEQNAAKSWYFRRQARRFERLEQRILAGVTRVVAVSPEDAALIRDRLAVACVDVVDNGVDNDYFAAVTAEREPERVVFLGSLEWRPNLDAVAALLDRIFPEVVARVPSARLCLVGRKPPDALTRRVRAIPWAELHADVDDVRPFLARSGVMVVPLRIGGGSRLKILEALASGLPVVSTRVGAEGLSLRAGRDLTVVENVDDVATALVESIRAPERAQAMAASGRQVVRERYDWSVLADKLEQVWVQCREAKPERARAGV